MMQLRALLVRHKELLLKQLLNFNGAEMDAHPGSTKPHKTILSRVVFFLTADLDEFASDPLSLERSVQNALHPKS